MLELIKAILASIAADTNELPTDSILTMIDSLGGDNE